MTQPFTFSSHGRPVHSALALPEGDAPAGAVLIVHEWYGLNEGMKRMADRFAAAGFVALAVDLYDGRVATEQSGAMALSGALKTADAVVTLGDAATALRAHPRVNGKVAVAGFCLGGAMALAAVCSVPGFAAAVPFYGVPRAEFLDWARCEAPVMGHYGEHDPMIPVERVRALADAAHAAGRDFTLHTYDARHAFMREGDAHAYNEPAAKLAWERTVAFLRAHLG